MTTESPHRRAGQAAPVTPSPHPQAGAADLCDRLLGIKTAAARLSVSWRTLYRMEDRGQIERVVITGRRFGYRESDIADIIAGRGNILATKVRQSPANTGKSGQRADAIGGDK